MDFPIDEFERRASRLQALMAEARLDALFLTTEPDVRYVTGFRTQFWESPTRPWFTVLPRRGKPIAVIPEIGSALMRKTWLDDILTWPAPHATENGVALLVEVLADAKRIGTPMGRESMLRMPLADFFDLKRRLPRAEFIDASPLIGQVRAIKSEREIAIIREICQIASRAFANAPALFHEGQPLSGAFRAFKRELLSLGADDVPYLAGGAGPDGYTDVISPPDDRPLQSGDVLMLDTGATKKGYFCDFDRNFAIGQASETARAAYRTLHAATDAAFAMARPGVRASELHAAMTEVIGGGDSDVGRYGHGIGVQLTEGLSIIDFDQTVLQPGMIITLEPSMPVSGNAIMAHEENVLITEDGREYLTERTADELPVIG